MLSSSSDRPRESLKIKKDDKFYSRLLSKESSVANPSFRVYYGVASGAVPFVWESQPGMPKNSIPTATLPPLTPPPSYHHPKNKNCTKKSPRSTLIHTFLPRLTMRKAHAPPPLPPVSLSSSSVSSSSSSFSPMGSSGSHRRSRFSSSRSSFSSRGEDEDSDDGSPTSTLCFGVRHGEPGGLRGCHSIGFMKNALLSIVGHGSGQGTAA